MRLSGPYVSTQLSLAQASPPQPNTILIKFNFLEIEMIQLEGTPQQRQCRKMKVRVKWQQNIQNGRMNSRHNCHIVSLYLPCLSFSISFNPKQLLFPSLYMRMFPYQSIHDNPSNQTLIWKHNHQTKKQYACYICSWKKALFGGTTSLLIFFTT